ncbi:MAG: hypothetical protein ACRD8U_09900 [Pyrinomonadaceae bacterium]
MTLNKTRIPVITPSYWKSESLKLAVASIADEKGVEHEHIVQDTGSVDGTLDWLLSDKRVKAYVEKERAVYETRLGTMNF